MQFLIDSLQRLFASRLKARVSMLVAGAIYPLGFAPFEWWPLAFVSLFLLLASFRIDKKVSSFQCGLFWGIGCFGFGASWVYVSIHEFGFVPMLGAAALTALFVTILSLYKGLFAFVVDWLIKRSTVSLFILIAPLAWVLSELIQATLFNGFPWLLTGYSQIDSPLGSIASILGVYGVSWFTLALTACMVMLVFSFKQQQIKVVTGILLGCVLVSKLYFELLPADQNKVDTLDVALVQPNVLQHEKWDRKFFGKIVNIMYEETQDVWGADLIVWPEGAIPAYEHQVNDIVYDLSKKAELANSHLLLGIPEYDRETKSSFVAMKSYGKELNTYHKQVLVPFGEYVPMEKWLRGVIQFLDLPMSGFTQATSQKAMDFDKFTLIPAICYEIAYPEIIRQLADSESKTPKLIVTVSNEAWFGDSFGPYQHMQMARMRSLELGVPLARATNDGITGFVDAKGNVQTLLPRYKQSHLRRDIELKNYTTIYRQWGYWGMLGIILVSILTLLIYARKAH